MAINATTVRMTTRLSSDVGRAVQSLDRSMSAAWVTAWDDLAPGIAKDLTDYLSQSGGSWPRPSDISRSAPLRKILTDANRALTGLADKADPLITEAAAGVATRSADAQSSIISSQLPVAWRAVLIEAVRDDGVASVINRTSRRITTLLKAVPSAVDIALRRALVRGVATVRGVRGTVQRMVKSLMTAFHTGLARILTIAGTEIADAHRAASAAGAREFSDVLSGWIWIARLDRNVCPACLAMHGSVHSLDQSGPDGHPRCRCIRVPKTKTWKELGVDIGLADPPEPEDLVKDAEDFFDTLSEKDKLRIMGPTRLAMLRDGLIKWGDLVMVQQNPGWRRAYVPTPVNRLHRR